MQDINEYQLESISGSSGCGFGGVWGGPWGFGGGHWGGGWGGHWGGHWGWGGGSWGWGGPVSFSSVEFVPVQVQSVQQTSVVSAPPSCGCN